MNTDKNQDITPHTPDSARVDSYTKLILERLALADKGLYATEEQVQTMFTKWGAQIKS